MANTIVTLSGDDAELYKAFQRILDSQKKIDEGYDKIRDASRRAAREAEAAAKEEARENDRRRESIANVADSIIGLATSYATIQTAISAVAQVQRDFVDRQEKSIDLARRLAAAQQEAAKNLAGQTPAAISETLQKTVPGIAQRAGFADLPAITTALGAAASIVGEDKARGVVEQSARLTRFTPGELQTTATATADLMAATGLSDAREALALLASTGSVARPEQLAKLATGASVAANAAIGGAPTQDTIAAAREGVALYSKLTRVDPQGQSAATATGALIGQVGALFTDTKAARERTDKIERLTEALEANKITIARAEESRERAQSREDNIGVLDAEQTITRAQSSGRRDAAELANLQAIQAAVSIDPGTFAARLEKIRATPALSQQLNETLTGEEKFLPLFRQLITAQTQTEDGSKAKQAESQLQTARAQWIEESKKRTALSKAGAPESEIIAQARIADAAESRFNEAKAKFEESRGDKAGQSPQQSQIVAAQDGAGRSGLFGEFQTALQTITTDVKAFEAVAQSTVATPQTAIAEAELAAETMRNVQSARDIDSQLRAAISGIKSEAMAASSVDIVTGFSSLLDRNVGNYGSRTLDTLPAFITSSQQVLTDRLDYISRGGGTPEQAQTVAAAVAAIERLARLPETLEAVAATGRETTSFLQRQTEIAEETNRILQTMRENGAPSPAAIRAQAQTPVFSNESRGR